MGQATGESGQVPTADSSQQQQTGTGPGSQSAESQPAAQTQSQVTGSGTGTSSSEVSEPQVFTKEYVEKIRTEAAGYRTQLRTAEQERDAAKTRVEEFEKAQLTKEELQERELEKMRTEMLPSKEKRIKELTVEVHSTRKNLDPKLVSKLIDWDAVDISDEDAVEKAIDDLVAEYPILRVVNESGTQGKAAEGQGQGQKRTQASTTSTASPATGTGEPKVFKRADLQGLSADEINELYDKGGLAEALKEGRVID